MATKVTLPTIEGVTVTGSLPSTSSVIDYAYNFFDVPNPSGPGREPSILEGLPELPEVVVLAGGNSGSEADSEGYRFNPATGIPYPPVDEMSDQEYADWLGGGDQGYEEMFKFRYPDTAPKPTETFAPPMPLLAPIVETVSVLGRVLLGGLAGLFVPLTAGPADLDEAPTPPKPPKNTPQPEIDPDERFPFQWTPLPEFTDPGPFPFAIPDGTGWFEVGNPVERREFPIGDYPGMLDPAPGLPEFPAPYFFPEIQPRFRPVPFPTGPTSDPYRDPLPFEFDDPYAPGEPEPRIPFAPEPKPFPDPYVVPFPDPAPRAPFEPVPRPFPIPFDVPFPDPYAPPKEDFFPRIGDPFPDLVDVPDIYSPPNPYLPPLSDPYNPFNPLDDPVTQTLPQPDQADACNCVKEKEKDKKKKKKKQLRTICYEGKYREHGKGLTKIRGKRIPCVKVSAKKAPRKAPTLPDLARDVFQLPGV